MGGWPRAGSPSAWPWLRRRICRERRTLRARGLCRAMRPPGPARPRRRIDWWKLGPVVATGTAPASPHPTETPGPAPHPGVLRQGPRGAAERGFGRAGQHRARAPGALWRGLCIQGTARWPPLPPAHGYSCRQQPITMASALPPGTACPFPSLCSQGAAPAPRSASLAPNQPRHLLGGSTEGLGSPKAAEPRAQVGVVLGERGRAGGVAAKGCQRHWSRSPGGGHIPQMGQHGWKGLSSPSATAPVPCSAQGPLCKVTVEPALRGMPPGRCCDLWQCRSHGGGHEPFPVIQYQVQAGGLSARSPAHGTER